MSRYTADEIQDKIDALEAEKNRLENNENEDDFDAILDEEGDVEIAGLTLSRSRILKEMDPTAYNCGMNDFNDGRLTEIEDELESLKSDLEDAKEEESEAAHD